MAKTRRPYTVSLCGPGIRLRLETDRHTCLELAEIVTVIVHGNATGQSSASTDPSLLPSPSDLDHDELHAFNHKNAPGALRALYETLCDDLLDDARQALDDEKRRRAEAS
jgi:hypothetical protein